MAYTIKVSLPNIKGFYRIYSVRPDASLYRLQNAMTSDMDFSKNIMVLFKAVDGEGNALARFSSVDMGRGTTDVVTWGQVHKQGFDSYVYFYDTVNKKSVLVDIIDTTSADQNEPVILLDSKGPIPREFENGYVAPEDMPKEKFNLKPNPDDDDDVEDEESDIEKEEEIYDENGEEDDGIER